VVVNTDAPLGIDTAAEDPDGAGDGVGVGDPGDELLHAIASISSETAIPN